VDRLQALIALTVWIACSGASDGPPVPPPSRFDAVMADPTPKQADPAEFCEGDPAAQGTQTFAWPALDGTAPPAGAGWTWINVWATWCAPCVEEMPRLQAWESELQAQAGPGQLRFLSVDATAAAVTRFQEHHPGQRTGVRIREFDQLAGWLPTVGLDAGAVLPIHLFLDASQQIRCVREGAVNKGDYDVVAQVLSGLKAL